MRYMLGPSLPYVYIGHQLFSIADVMLFTIENKTYFNQLAQPFMRLNLRLPMPITEDLTTTKLFREAYYGRTNYCPLVKKMVQASFKTGAIDYGDGLIAK